MRAPPVKSAPKESRHESHHDPAALDMGRGAGGQEAAVNRPPNPFSRHFPGYRIGRLRIWPWVGFWEVKRFRMGTTLILHVGCAVVVVVEGGES